MFCDMCGSKGEMFKVNIDDSVLTVCIECSKFGKVISTVKPKEMQKKKEAKEEKQKIVVVSFVMQDYAEKVKKARETRGLRQEEFAKKINEKESVIHNIESGRFEPPIELAKKLEKILHIKLVEQYEDLKGIPQKTREDTYTIGDFIKIKK